MQRIIKNFRLWALLLVLSVFAGGRMATAQEHAVPSAPPVAESHAAEAASADARAAESHGTEAHAEEGHGEGGHAAGGVSSPFDPHNGTWLNGISRRIFGIEESPEFGEDSPKHVHNRQSVLYDSIVLAVIVMALLGGLCYTAAKKGKIRPEGKPHSLANAVEFAVEGYREYLIGVMGKDLALRYAPLISSFFFTILFMNWLGLVPGMVSPTANPNVPLGMGLVAFVCVHVIAIREAGFKSWIMHFVGEPLWLAPLNFPLHIIGELVKPISLSLRLLCNVFGEEMVVAVLAGLAVTALPWWLPIPFQLPMLFLGTFFGFLQALVFSTLLAIYISIFATHHDDHDEHNEHGHVEHVRSFGHNNTVAHPTESPVA